MNVASVAAECLSETTRATYARFERGWVRWLAGRDASEDLMAEWLVGKTRRGQSYRTVTTALAAVNHFRREAGLPVFAGGLVRDVMRGLSRMSAPPKQAMGLTSERMSLIRLSPKYTVRDEAMLLLMRDGLLRQSEAAALLWADLTVHADGSGRVHVARSKTDQTGRGSVLWVSPATVRALHAWREEHSTDPMFGLKSRSVGERIRLLARDSPLGDGYSGHSPRVGMAQDLAAAGMGLTQLMVAGRWTSPAMPARYTRHIKASTGAVALYYGGAE